jgi:hypothetical protein
MGFETPEPIVYPPFLLQLWKTHGRGTAKSEVKTTKKKKMTTTTRLKKTPSEDIVFSSLFLMFYAKGREEDP